MAIGDLVSGLLGSSPSPFERPDVWGSIGIGSDTWRGKFVIHNLERIYEWQNKTAAGIEGAQQTYRGKPPPAFEIIFYIWDTDGYNNWLKFQKNFLYQGVKKDPNPVSIRHPSLANIGITKVICEALGAVTLESDDLLYSVRVKLREFFPVSPKDVTKTPKTTKDPTNITGDPQNAALDAAQDQFQKQVDIAILDGNPGFR